MKKLPFRNRISSLGNLATEEEEKVLSASEETLKPNSRTRRRRSHDSCTTDRAKASDPPPQFDLASGHVMKASGN